MAVSEKGICIGILISMLIIMMIYIIILFECYKSNTFIFSPYTTPNPPTEENPFKPTGEDRLLNADELKLRDCYVSCGLYGGTACECIDKLKVAEDMIN